MSIISEKPVLIDPDLFHISVPVPVDRDMLAYALADTNDGSWGPLDDWSVEFIREYVGVTLAVRGSLNVAEDARRSWLWPTERDYVESAYRAIDRAYPELAPAVTS